MKHFSFQLKLDFDEEVQQVIAGLKPVIGADTFSPHHLEYALEDAGYTEFFRLEENILALCSQIEKEQEHGQKIYQEFIKRAESARAQLQTAEENPKEDHPSISAEHIYNLLPNKPQEVAIAEKRDGELALYPSEDEMELCMCVSKPFGGKAIDRSQIDIELEKLAVKAVVNETIITAALESQTGEPCIIAKGTQPKKGKDSSFQAIVNPQITSTPVIDEKGIANYLDINDFVVVEPGEPLMERLNPRLGKPGQDIFGKVIPAEEGDLLPFDGNIEGATIDPNNVNLLIATIKGHPIILDRGVSIDPVLQLPNVSLATGNIEYDGTVYVKGDIADGMKIKVSGDLIVDGVVGKSTISAGNDVVIKQGLIGGIVNEGKETSFAATIDAGGSVSVRFANEARIDAEENVSIREYASHCAITAADKVLVGEESGKGTLIGGHTRAFNMISAKVIGSTGGAITNICVGAAADTIDNLRKVSFEIKKRKNTCSQLGEELLDIKLRQKKTGLSNHIIEKRAEYLQEFEKLQQEIQQLSVQADELKSLLMRSKKASVVGRNKIYQNAIVSILNSSYKVKDDLSGASFRFEARRVVVER